jgi:pimeloyl-ACP methyl ester carboxylesterase
MPSTRHRFLNRKALALAALYEQPADGPPQAQALFAHCFTCGKDVKAAYHISRALADAGIGVMRFDFTGLGESQGQFAETTFTSNVEDLIDAAAYMGEIGLPPVLLIGHSLGGAAVIQAAAAIASVKAVATIAAPANPAHVARHLKGARAGLPPDGETRLEVAGRHLSIGQPFIEDIARARPEDALARLACALLVMHSPLDRIVGIENAARIFAAARHPKSFIALEGADHLLSDRQDARYVGRLIAVWASRYILPADTPTSPS